MKTAADARSSRFFGEQRGQFRIAASRHAWLFPFWFGWPSGAEFHPILGGLLFSLQRTGPGRFLNSSFLTLNFPPPATNP